MSWRGGDVLAFAADHRRGVDAEDHFQGRFIDLQPRQRIVGVDGADRIADFNVLESLDRNDVAGAGRFGSGPSEFVEHEQARDFLFVDAIALMQVDRLAQFDGPRLGFVRPRFDRRIRSSRAS